MPRIRSIKPQFFTHEELSALPPTTHLLAAGLLCYADDEGYFNANPALVRAAIFPVREGSLKIHDMLSELSNMGYIRLGKGADGRTYGHIINFAEHQRVNRPNPSKIKDLEISWEDSLRTHGMITEDSVGEEGIRNKEKGMEGARGNTRNVPAPEGFDAFWSAYPRKAAKPAAIKAYAKVNPDTEMLKAMLRTIGVQCQSEAWKKDGGQFIPHPATWLNQRRWEDETEEKQARLSLEELKWGRKANAAVNHG